MRTRKLALAVTAVAALGVAAMPAVSSAAISNFEKKQNAKIKKANNKVNNAIDDLEALEGDLSESNTTQNNKNTSQDETIASLQSTVDTIVAGVPSIVNGLTALQAGLTTVGNSLTNTVGPALTALQAGLVSAGAALQAVEYGALGLFVGGGTTPAATLVSSDIPDDGNPASVSGQLPVQAAGATTLHLRAAIRSNESDGGATGDPAGQVGGLLYAVCASGGGCAGGAVPAGVVACTPVQTGAQDFALPDGSTKSLTLVNLQQKVSRTNQDEPDGSAPDALGGGCNLPGAGLYIAYVNAQFVDLPTSLSPGPTD